MISAPSPPVVMVPVGLNVSMNRNQKKEEKEDNDNIDRPTQLTSWIGCALQRMLQCCKMWLQEPLSVAHFVRCACVQWPILGEELNV